MSQTVERMRIVAASVDGSFLDTETWRARHRHVVLLARVATLFILAFSIADPDRPYEWIYTAVALTAVLLASVSAWSRRVREMLTAVGFVTVHVYVMRYVGGIMLGPLALIVLTFYQDWAPLAVGLAAAAGMVIVAWLDPGFFSGTSAFAHVDPVTGMAMRSAAIALAALLGLAIWRSGTQLARDQLTGMLSRLGAERMLDREIGRGRRPAVWVCDIDNFSAVNRQLGSTTGDMLLRHVATRLRRTAGALPGGALCARLGGDTFLIAHGESCDPDTVEVFAHRIETDAGVSVNGLARHEVPVRMSVGAAIAAPGETAAHLIRAAERNMRAAKGRGSARVVVDRSNDRPVESGGTLLISELYSACERDELVLHLQPIVSLADGLPVGAELLARWNHPQRGLVYPVEFLPEAELDSALMAVVSRTLARSFLSIAADFAARHGHGWLPYGLSYNLAAIRLRDPTLSAGLLRDLRQAGLDGHQASINLEVTEGALMDIEYGAPEVLAGLRALGYGIALDDFGTGHSSLAHLRDFPLDTVKLDKSFVQSMGRSPIDRAVVQAVADIASASGLRVIAEGVETPEQRDMLLAIKQDMLAQGWLYARAMPVEQFEAWVLDRRAAAVA